MAFILLVVFNNGIQQFIKNGRKIIPNQLFVVTPFILFRLNSKTYIQGEICYEMLETKKSLLPNICIFDCGAKVAAATA